MTFTVKILGSNSAMPAYGRHHSAQLLQIDRHFFLIDCGEGTQLQLSEYKVKAQKITRVFISHLHGDHYLGLIGLVKTMHLQGREAPLYIYGPQGLREIITIQLKYSFTVLNYDIIFQQVDNQKSHTLYEDDLITVQAFPLNHRIQCSGFVFREKAKSRRINKEKIPEDMPIEYLKALKKGEDIKDEKGDILIENESVTLDPRKSRGYAYCSDTKYEESIIPHIQGVDLLYHEATFLDEKDFWAEQTYHSTTKQAATIALRADVERLLIGHFSARYKDLTPFEEEARAVFPNTFLAIEGKDFEVHL